MHHTQSPFFLPSLPPSLPQTGELDIRSFYPTWDPERHYIYNTPTPPSLPPPLPQTGELDIRSFYLTWDPERHYIVTVLTLLKKIFYMKVSKRSLPPSLPPSLPSFLPGTQSDTNRAHPRGKELLYEGKQASPPSLPPSSLRIRPPSSFQASLHPSSPIVSTSLPLPSSPSPSLPPSLPSSLPPALGLRPLPPFSPRETRALQPRSSSTVRKGGRERGEERGRERGMY